MSDGDERALFTGSMELLARSYLESARRELPVIGRFRRKQD